MADAGANSPIGRGTQSQSSTLPYDTNALLCKLHIGAEKLNTKHVAMMHFPAAALYGMSAGLLGAGAGAVPSAPSLAGLLPTAPNPPAVPGGAATGDTGSSAAWLQVN